MPAAAVIPAPIAYTKVVAVKKLVVEPRAVVRRVGFTAHTRPSAALPRGATGVPLAGRPGDPRRLL